MCGGGRVSSGKSVSGVENIESSFRTCPYISFIESSLAIFLVTLALFYISARFQSRRSFIVCLLRLGAIRMLSGPFIFHEYSAPTSVNPCALATIVSGPVDADYSRLLLEIRSESDMT